MGGEGVGLLVWVGVCCHGCGFGFAMGLGLGLPLWVAVFFFFFLVDGRLWVANGGGVRCV